MNSNVNCVDKDTQLIACKKRAKEILKNNGQLNTVPNLTLMNCLEIAAKEMKYSSWHELRTSIKNKNIKNEINHVQKWDEFIIQFFMNDYESLHFEVREKGLTIRGRKYGLIDILEHDFSISFMDILKEKLSINPSDYDWTSNDNYNIQSVPVHDWTHKVNNTNNINNKGNKNKIENISYDLIVVKKDNIVIKRNPIVIAGTTGSGMKTTLKTLLNNIEKEKPLLTNLLNLGFNKKSIDYMTHNFEYKNFIVGSVVGNGKSRTADLIVNELSKKYKIVEIDDNMSDQELSHKVIEGMKIDPDYFYFPELRSEKMAQMIKKVLGAGYKYITTVHANSIDGIYDRVKQYKVELFQISDDAVVNTCFIYQKLGAILCDACKEKDLSFNEVWKNEGFIHYVNKFNKQKEVQNNMYKKGNTTLCKNKLCHHGLTGKKVIAEVFNTNGEENEKEYVRFYDINNKEKKIIGNIEFVKQGKMSEYLSLKSRDLYSYKYEAVLKGEMEL